jgi:hypothetical protein
VTIRILSAYACFEVVVRGNNPDSISKSYLGAIGNHVDLNSLNPNFQLARTDKRFSLTMKGLKRVYRDIHPEIESRKMAVTLNMLDYIDDALGSPTDVCSTIIRFVETLALRMGIYFLMRRSEYLPGRSTRGVQWKHILFYNSHGDLISRHSLQRGQAHTVVNNIPFSKTDPHGRGRIVSHFRQPDGFPCIVRDMEEWAIISRDRLNAIDDDYFFEVHGSPLVYDRRLVAILRAVARYLGIRDHAISLHSLRYGGATLLATAGLPKYVIEHFGGWAPDSGAIREYIQLGGESAQTVSRAMSLASSAGLADARIRSNYFGRR